jgi:hypothetical protein
MEFREITDADVPALFDVRTRTRAWLTTDVDTTLRAYGFYRPRGWTDWKIENGLRWMELHPSKALKRNRREP